MNICLGVSIKSWKIDLPRATRQASDSRTRRDLKLGFQFGTSYFTAMAAQDSTPVYSSRGR